MDSLTHGVFSGIEYINIDLTHNLYIGGLGCPEEGTAQHYHSQVQKL